MNSTLTPLGLAAVYNRVQQFYAAQMQLLDGGDIAGYASTFTLDAEFAHTPGRAPARTRAGIIEDLADFHKKFSEDPMQRRHHVSMINLREQEDGSLESTAYCLVVKVRPGQQPIFVSCVMHDVVVAEADGFLTRSRHVSYD